jgi:hypothetical protein
MRSEKLKMPREVAEVFDAFPKSVRSRLFDVRELIFKTAAELRDVGPLTEALRWGEPAYLTEATGSGSTIRLGKLNGSDEYCAVFFNCRTTLVETFRDQFPESFGFEKNRAIVLKVSGALPKRPLAMCLSMALTYRMRSKLKNGSKR